MTSMKKSFPCPDAYCRNLLELTSIRTCMELGGLPVLPGMVYVSIQQLVFGTFFSYTHILNNFKCLLLLNSIQNIQVQWSF